MQKLISKLVCCISVLFLDCIAFSQTYPRTILNEDTTISAQPLNLTLIKDSSNKRNSNLFPVGLFVEIRRPFEMLTSKVLGNKSFKTADDKKEVHNLNISDTSVTSSYLGNDENNHFTIESMASFTTEYIPFWFRSRQFGSIPVSGLSLGIVPFAFRDYGHASKKSFSWGAGLEARINLGANSNFTLVQAYGKIKLADFELKVGRSKDVVGLMDTALSSGSFSISGNTLGIPKFEISIPEYTYLFGGKTIALQGSFAHGLVGEVPIQGSPYTTKAKTFYHHKSLYIKFRRPDWRVAFLGGFNHQVFWGNEKLIFGNEFKLSKWQAYQYVFLGKNLHTANIAKVGNHLGTVDLGLQYNANEFQLFLYRQSFYDAGALGHFANILDGLNGMSITNKRSIQGTRRVNYGLR
jgi:hypothetical protein